MSSDALTLSVIASSLSDDPRVAPRVARAMGFGGVQFDAFSTPFNVTELSQTGRREFLHVLSGADQKLAGLRVDLGPKGFGPGADVDRLLSQLAKVMDAAVGLQSRLVCVELGPLPEPAVVENPRPKVDAEMAGLLILPSPVLAPPPPQRAAPPDRKFISAIETAMLELAGQADRYGVTLAFRSDLASFAALKEAVDGPRCPWFGIDLDPVAVLRDTWSMDEIFSAVGPMVRHVVGRDATCGADNRTKPQPLGRGDTAWPQLLCNLDATGYHGFLTIDPLQLTDRPGAAAAGAKFIRALAIA